VRNEQQQQQPPPPPPQQRQQERQQRQQRQERQERQRQEQQRQQRQEQQRQEQQRQEQPQEEQQQPAQFQQLFPPQLPGVVAVMLARIALRKLPQQQAAAGRQQQQQQQPSRALSPIVTEAIGGPPPSFSPPSFSILRETSDSSGPIGGNHLSRLLKAAGGSARPHTGHSGFHGVTAKRNRWQAYIHYDGKRLNLGTYDTKQEAALAYDRAAWEHGGKRKLNYVSIKAAEAAAAAAQA
jgi:hypothetical protein